jgi:murein DD-endopeptidase MepM/ murein hydrolase activator NlpD
VLGFKRVFKPFFNLIKIALSPFGIFWNLLYRGIFVNAYKFALLIQRYLNTLLSPVKNKLLFLFINKYVVHLIIILLAVSVVFFNYQIKETRAESYGENSILYSLVSGSNKELYTEETLEVHEVVVSSYTERQTTTISASPQVVLKPEETDPQSSVTTISQGSSALLKPTFSSISGSQVNRNEEETYVVQDDDTISTIAQQFNLKTNSILWANGLSASSLIRKGQKLIIPPVDGVMYTVKSGDNVNKLADKYESDADKIIAFNRLADATDIQVGQKLMLPDGKPYAPPAQAVTSVASVSRIFEKTEYAPVTGSGMIWPTRARRISQYYGWGHTGLDIDGEFGDAIWAVEEGTVTKSVCQTTGYGCHVIIDHGGGKITLYAHFQKLYVTTGQYVAQGQVLGEMGSTGHSTGSHLHFEIKIGGKRYNPLSYIR